MSFAWVGHYQYRYNLEVLNSTGLNLYAFIWWSLGIFATVETFASVEKAIRRAWLSLLVTSAIYLVGLFAIEFVGYEVLGIREVGHPTRKPLVGGLIHGTRSLFFVYLSFPVASVLGFLVASRFFSRAVLLGSRVAAHAPRSEAPSGSP